MRHAAATSTPDPAVAGPQFVLSRPTAFQRCIQWFAATRSGAWLFARTLPRLDHAVLRVTKGQQSMAGLLAGLPLITLTTTGAKSGVRRSVPLIGLPDGERIVVIGTNFGQQHHPAWYYNLRANPAAILTYRGQRRHYVAREATAEERTRCWQEAVRVYPGYATYLTRLGGRRVPIMLLTPSSPQADGD